MAKAKSNNVLIEIQSDHVHLIPGGVSYNARNVVGVPQERAEPLVNAGLATYVGPDHPVHDEMKRGVHIEIWSEAQLLHSVEVSRKHKEENEAYEAAKAERTRVGRPKLESEVVRVGLYKEVASRATFVASVRGIPVSQYLSEVARDTVYADFEEANKNLG